MTGIVYGGDIQFSLTDHLKPFKQRNMAPLPMEPPSRQKNPPPLNSSHELPEVRLRSAGSVTGFVFCAECLASCSIVSSTSVEKVQKVANALQLSKRCERYKSYVKSYV